jgi:hypothetical protein
MNLSEALLHALKEHGAREIFGIPGDYALPFFKVVEESGILPLYTLSHEPAFDAQALAACADEILARLRAARSPVLIWGFCKGAEWEGKGPTPSLGPLFRPSEEGLKAGHCFACAFIHSLARRFASAICSGVIKRSTMLRLFLALSSPLAAAIFHHLCAST